MNRAQRRQAERNMRRGIEYNERIVPLPALLDEFTVFDMVQSIMDQISNGAIDAMQGVPVFRDNSGVWQEVIPPFEGWVFTWEKINTDLNIGIDLLPLKIISKRLNSSTPITRENITKAMECLNHCRQAFRSANRADIVRISRTAQLQILLESKIQQPKQ